MTDKVITNTAELGSLSYMGLDNHITRILEQVADGIKDSDKTAPNLSTVEVVFDLVVEGQTVSFIVPVSVAE